MLTKIMPPMIKKARRIGTKIPNISFCNKPSLLTCSPGISMSLRNKPGLLVFSLTIWTLLLEFVTVLD